MMSNPDNPPEVDAETLEAAVWVVSNLPEDLLQLALDGVDPNDPVISAVRAMNNGTNGGTADGILDANATGTRQDERQIGSGGDVQGEEEEERQEENESGAISSDRNSEDARIARLEETVQQLTAEVARQGEEIARLRAERAATEATA